MGKLILCASLLVALGLMPSAVPGPQDKLQIGQHARAYTKPGLILNEVMFDPMGAEGTDTNAEWVEIYAVSATNLQGYQLEDNQGNAIGGPLPAMNLPASAVVAVFFGPRIPFAYDSDASDRSAAIALDLPLGDHLNNNSGGVRLRKPGGKLADKVFWSNTGIAPIGSGGWFVDISMNGTPVVEGCSLGRPANPIKPPGTSLWQVNGCNAAGPSPAGRNGINAGWQGLLFDTQAGINQILSFLTLLDPGKFSVLQANLYDITANYQTDTTVLSARHVVWIEVDGALATPFDGTLTTTFTRDESVGSVSWQLDVAGSLAAPGGQGLDINYSELHWGFHTNQLSVVVQNDITYREAGQDYPVSLAAQIDTIRTGPNTWMRVDDRQVTDFGGAGLKTSHGVSQITKLGDGDYTADFTVTRDYPIVPPRFSDAGFQSIQGTETLHIVNSSLMNDCGEVLAGQLQTYDQDLDGFPLLQLQPGKTGTYSFLLKANGMGTLPEQTDFALDLPLTASGFDFVAEGRFTGWVEVFQGKLLSHGLSTFGMDGYELARFEFYADPPFQGCPHCGGQNIIHIHVCPVNCDGSNPPPPPPPPPDPEPPPPPEPQTVGGFAAASAICTGSGVGIGGGIGAVGGLILGGAAGPPGSAAAGIAGGKLVGLIGGGVGWLVCGGAYLLGWWGE